MSEPERSIGYLAQVACTWEVLARKETLLHCTSNYPADPKDLNLRAMATLAETFGVKVGYSDHSQGIAIPIAAAPVGGPAAGPGGQPPGPMYGSGGGTQPTVVPPLPAPVTVR